MNCSSSGKSFLVHKQLNIKSQKILRFNTFERQIQIDNLKGILPDKINLKKRISNLHCIEPIIKAPRKYTDYSEESSPNFSPKKSINSNHYESKLNVSCESWVLYDMIKKQYKRGYKPNKLSTFNGLFRIIVLLVYCELTYKIKEHKKLKVLINTNNLKQKKIISPCNKKHNKTLKILLQRKKTDKTFSKGSIIYLYDLIRAMIISGSQDLFEYSLLVCGYLISCLQNDVQINQSRIVIQEGKQGNYADILCSFANKYLNSEIKDIIDSKTINKDENYQFISTTNEISTIFLAGMQKHAIFKEVVQLETIACYFKYQIGFNYWEQRKIIIKSSNSHNKKCDYFCKIIYKGQKNYDAICYNQNLHILMIVQDSKFSMADFDIVVLEDWFSNVIKNIRVRSSSIVSPTKTQKRTLPLITISNN